jgi:DNA excision repair protein ERCC-3
MSTGPLIVQSDKTLLLDIDHPDSVECRRAIAPFAELERSPEHIHTYRLTNLGLWNARAAGHDIRDTQSPIQSWSMLQRQCLAMAAFALKQIQFTV